jgi:hypothetical protein
VEDVQAKHLDVHLPYGCVTQSKDQAAVMTILSFDINDTPEEDFLSRVFATAGVEHGKEKLGWKTCDDKKKAPYRHLETPEDVRHAFDAQEDVGE